MRWFSTFTQRSLGEAERVELARAELAPSTASSPSWREAAEEGGVAELADRRFRAPLDLVPDEALVVIAAAEEIGRRSTTTGRT